MKKLLLLFATTLLLGACGAKTESKGTATSKVEDKTEETGTATDESTDEETTDEDDSEEVKLEDGVAARNVFTVDHQEEWHGITFDITDISVVQFDDQETINALDTEYLVGVKFVVKNSGKNSISTYPDQGQVVINGKQFDADFMVSDSVGGDVATESSIDGVVAYPISGIESIDDVKDIRVLWSAYDDSDYEDSGKDFDVNLSLNK